MDSMRTTYTTKAAGICKIDKLPFWGTVMIAYEYEGDPIDVHLLDAHIETLAKREMLAEEFAILLHQYISDFLSDEYTITDVAVFLEVESLRHGAITVAIGGELEG